MIRTAAFAALALSTLAGATLAGAPPAAAQVGVVAPAIFGLECLPNKAGSVGNIMIIYHGRGYLPAGTVVTISYSTPVTIRLPFGGTQTVGSRQQVGAYRTRHNMYIADPESTGFIGSCDSATYVSNQPLLSQ